MREAILSGKLAAGEKIVETKLATELCVSRSPVREAMQLLVTEQLIVEQDGTLCVFQPTVNDLYELYDLRLAVEPAATRKAAQVVRNHLMGCALPDEGGKRHPPGPTTTAAKLALLENNLEQMRRCLTNKDTAGVIRLNSNFHETIWILSENTRFVRILENASDLIQYYCLLVLNINNNQTNIVQEHSEIYNAICQGDESTAYQAMYDHIMKDLNVIRSKSHTLSAYSETQVRQ